MRRSVPSPQPFPKERGRRWWVAALGLLLTALAILLLWPGSPVAQRLQRDVVWERVQRERTLRIGLDPGFPPFEYEDGNGVLVGFDVDLARALADRLGVWAEFVPIHLDGLIDALQAQRIDVAISALPLDPRLTQDVHYTPPYFNAGQVLVVREGETAIERVDDLAGRRLVVEWGSSGDVEARRLRPRLALTLIPVDTPQTALNTVREGRADAALVDAVSAASLGRTASGLKTVGGPVTDEPYVIAVGRGSPRLWQAINEALSVLQQEGILDRLRQTWF